MPGCGDILPDVFAYSGITDRQAFIHQLAMDVCILETLLPHTVATPAVILLQASLNFFRNSVSHHSWSVFSRGILGSCGQELVNPHIGIGLDGSLICIDV